MRAAAICPSMAGTAVHGVRSYPVAEELAVRVLALMGPRGRITHLAWATVAVAVLTIIIPEVAQVGLAVIRAAAAVEGLARMAG